MEWPDPWNDLAKKRSYLFFPCILQNHLSSLVTRHELPNNWKGTGHPRQRTPIHDP